MFKPDVNHGEIKRALIKAGRPVFDAAKFGGGISDLITTHINGRVVFIEVKRPGPPSARRLTDAEVKFQRLFPDSYFIVQTEDEALRAVGVPQGFPWM